MILVVTEKNNAAQKIAELLSDVGKPTPDKVYGIPVYHFTHNDDAWVTIGLKGHILAPDFPSQLKFSDEEGWYAEQEDSSHVVCNIPDRLAHPPYDTKRKPFLKDGIDIKGWKVESLPYLVWAPIEKLPAEKQIIRALKNLAKKADAIIIGTDFDREGELIGSDALHEIQAVATDTPVSRARYSALTKGEIEHAFNNLVELDQNLADAGESRQYIDLIWGAVLTRYLTVAKFGGFGNVRSAGRVQTPTLALVVEKERERQAFVPEDYWVISAQLTSSGIDFKATHATARFKDEQAANEAWKRVKDATEAHVTNVKKRQRHVRPPAPFNTTSLQAAAAAEGLTPARTMRLAESLYMNGLISYPRVDNTVYPASMDLRASVKMLDSVPQYAPVCKHILKGAIHPTRGKQETTDHPPIHPTAPADPSQLQPAEWKLYNLVARRFLATLMDSATIEGTKVELACEGEMFQATGDVLIAPGFRAIYPFGLKRDEQLPPLEQGDIVSIVNIDFAAKQTEPPARYSQGRLVQEMERKGLGTKSTRASIVERLYQVKYLKNDPIEPSQLGMAIIDALHEYAPHITSPDMTSQLEDDMNKVAEGSHTQDEVVYHSRALLADLLDGLIEHKDDLGEAISDAVTADAKVGVCPSCGKDLVLKSSAKTRSNFIGCMGWPDCDVTYPVPTGRIQPIEGEAGTCPVCKAPRIKVQPFRSRPYELCVNPACETNHEPDLEVGRCTTCAEAHKEGKLIAHKSTRTGKRYIRCTNFEECQTSYPLPQRGELRTTGESCPDCNAPIVEVISQRGPWRICVNMNCPAKKDKATTTKGKRRGTRTRSTSRARSASRSRS